MDDKATETMDLRRVLLEHREFILTLAPTDPLRRVCDLAVVRVHQQSLEQS
jgi:hypothetical protein